MIERPKSTSRRACVALAVSTLFVFLPAHSQPTDADFAAARDAYRAGDAARLDLLAPRLKGHLLEPYVAYWQLTLNLDQAEPAAVTAFLARNADSPLAERLRVEWLKSLAKRGDWKTFADAYVNRAGDDTELACYVAQWKQQSEGDRALEDARGFWFSSQEQPESCRPVFATLLANGNLTSRDIWTRFRLAHEAGNYKLAARVSSDVARVGRPAPRACNCLLRVRASGRARRGGG